MGEYQTIEISHQESLAVLTLNRPDRLNALTAQMKEEMTDAVRALAAGKQARALLLTGAGRGFCAGADLMDGGLRDPGADLISTYHPLFLELSHLPMPIVTAVNGAAAGAGASLALAGDLVIAAEDSYFLQAFVNIGLVPDAGSSYLLPRLVGKARAAEMMMLGEKLPAAKAAEWGLINRVVPASSLMDEAMALTAKLAQGPTLALSGIRQLLRESFDNSFAAQLQAEALVQRQAGLSEDCKEGIMAFAQKRDAAFKGR